MSSQKQWLSIVDYANGNDLSISTVRRRIKNKKVIFKKQDGKFFILATLSSAITSVIKNENFENLKQENQKLRELLTEQNMLIKVYEEKLNRNVSNNSGIWGSYSPELNQ